ncbi:radical SAM protein [Archaeoglobales archaeon]|nr:MAG: radical SAM protein [Archaeoglobales archaeon]
MECKLCGGKAYSRAIPFCSHCVKKEEVLNYLNEIHDGLDKIGKKSRFKCKLCSNECGLNDNDISLCRLKGVKNGKMFSLTTSRKAVMSYYEDPLPTNCCNAWFCDGSKLQGTNLAVFYYGCNFDCLYCQNWTHKKVGHGRIVKLDEIVKYSMKDRIKCICHFGGSPEPQIAFAIKFSQEVLKERDIMICWEWNGAGRQSLALKAAKLSYKSNGTVKFDLKAWNNNLHKILTGRSNEQTLRNFEKIYEEYNKVVSATTLLVPYYVDKEEVEGIAKFIAGLDASIPYSLLIFHPDYRLSDLPITPKQQVIECYEVAKKHLKNVNVGNIHLLGW